MTDPAERVDPIRLAWLMLPGQRPYRELHWLSLMPGAQVTAIGERSPLEPVAFVERGYRRLTRRFIEAGALAWARDLDTVPDGFDWVASLELCALVTGQASRFANRRGIRQAILTWGNDPQHPLYRLPPYSRALRRSRGADLFLCLIESAKHHCVALGLPEERCTVVYPGIDTELFHPPEEPCDEPVLLFASPLTSNKGIDRVLEAFILVRRRVPEARLLVAGRGPLENLVRERAGDMEGSVELLGGLDRAAIATVMRRSAAFVTAPRANRVWSEQFGVAYIEAMACGLPVVTTVCGTNHEAVKSPNLRVPDQAGALAEASLCFLQDLELRKQVASLNRRYVLEHHELRRQSALMGEAFRRTRST